MLIFCRTDDNEALIERAAGLVSEQRRRKALRLSSRRARANSLAAELLAVKALSAFGVSPRLLRFESGGRPYVEGDAAFISLSHSGEYVACAVSDRGVGVDVQQIRRVVPAVIRRVCSEKEAAALDPEDLDGAFLRVWSLKEAWRKANPTADLPAMLRAEFLIAPDGSVSGPAGFVYRVSDGLKGYTVALCEAI